MKKKIKNDFYGVVYVIRFAAIREFYERWGVDVDESEAYYKTAKALGNLTIDHLETLRAFLDEVVLDLIHAGRDAVIEKQGNLYTKEEVKNASTKYYPAIKDVVKSHVLSLLNDGIYYARRRLATASTVA